MKSPAECSKSAGKKVGLQGLESKGSLTGAAQLRMDARGGYLIYCRYLGERAGSLADSVGIVIKAVAKGLGGGGGCTKLELKFFYTKVQLCLLIFQNAGYACQMHCMIVCIVLKSKCLLAH